MLGVRLEVQVHVVSGAVTAAQNICRSIHRAGLAVRDELVKLVKAVVVASQSW